MLDMQTPEETKGPRAAHPRRTSGGGQAVNGAAGAGSISVSTSVSIVSVLVSVSVSVLVLTIQLGSTNVSLRSRGLKGQMY